MCRSPIGNMMHAQALRLSGAVRPFKGASQLIKGKPLSRLPPLRSPNVKISTRAMATAEHKPEGHATGERPQLDPELEAFFEGQRGAARISLAEEARTLVSLNRHGVISTLSVAHPGYPQGSVVQYADGSGRPIFAFSSMSGHTGDLRKDGRCSLTIMAPNFQGMSDARVTLIGEVVPVSKENKAAVRETYLQANPESYWVDFGDFTWFQMDSVVSGRVIGGFARAGTVTSEEYLTASPDPVARFSEPVAGHMNRDHADSTAAIVRRFAGLAVDEARILTLDRLGMNVLCKRQGQQLKARVCYPRPVVDRKDIKTVIVEMTQAAAAAASNT